MSIKNSPEMPQTELNYELFFCSISQPTSPSNHPNSYLQTKKKVENKCRIFLNRELHLAEYVDILINKIVKNHNTHKWKNIGDKIFQTKKYLMREKK